MSNDANEPEEDFPEEEKVGYKQPPKKTQFKPGTSGNRRGRPKKKKVRRYYVPAEVQLAERIFTESRRPMEVRENGEIISLSTIDVVMRSMSTAAVKGSTRAQVAYTNLVRVAEKAILDDWSQTVESVTAYKHRWWGEIQQAELLGRKPPEPVPHPDEIVLDHDYRKVLYNGPSDEAEKLWWDKQFKRAVDARQSIKETVAEIRAELRLPYAKRQQGIMKYMIEDITFELMSIAIVERLYPTPAVRRVPGFDLETWRRKAGASRFKELDYAKQFRDRERVRLEKKFEDEDPESIA